MATLKDKVERIRKELGLAEGLTTKEIIDSACAELNVDVEGKSIMAKADAVMEMAGIELGSVVPVAEEPKYAVNHPEVPAAPADIHVTVVPHCRCRRSSRWCNRRPNS